MECGKRWGRGEEQSALEVSGTWQAKIWTETKNVSSRSLKCPQILQEMHTP